MVASTKLRYKFLMSKESEIVAKNEDSPRKEDREGEEERSGKWCKMVEVSSTAAVQERSNEFSLICLLY